MINLLLPYWHFLQRHFRSVYHDSERHFDFPMFHVCAITVWMEISRNDHQYVDSFLLLGYVQCERQHFLKTPKDSEVTEGDTAILHCQVGNQIGQVQWTKDGLTLGWLIEAILTVYNSILFYRFWSTPPGIWSLLSAWWRLWRLL